MNVLVFGGSGWIGRQLVRILLEESDHRLECWVRSTTAAERLLKFQVDSRLTICLSEDLTRCKPGLDPDVVFHAASPTMHWDLKGAIDTNIGLTLHLLDTLSGRQTRPRLIFLSTLLLRGNSNGAFSEADLDAGQVFLTPYAQMKFLAETALRTTYISDVESISIRIGSVLWERNGSELPYHDWLCQAVDLWTRGYLEVLPLPAKHNFFPIAIDDLCRWLARLVTESEVPSVLHFPEVPGPNLDEVFSILSKAAQIPAPIFCESDSQRWTCHLDKLGNGMLRRRLANLFPIPPRGARLSTVNSEKTSQWLRHNGLQSLPFSDDYWLNALGKRPLPTTRESI